MERSTAEYNNQNESLVHTRKVGHGGEQHANFSVTLAVEVAVVMAGTHEVAGHVRWQHVVDQRLVPPTQVYRLLGLHAHSLTAGVTRSLQRLALIKTTTKTILHTY